MRRFFVDKGDKPHGGIGRASGCVEPRNFEQRGDPGGVIIRARRAPRRIVVSADDDDASRCTRTREFGFDVGDLGAVGAEDLLRRCVAGPRELGFDVQLRGPERAVVAQVSRANRAREMVHVTAQPRSQFTHGASGSLFVA